MSPLLPLPRGDVSYATVAKNIQHPNISLSHGIDGSWRSSWTISPQRPGSNFHDTTVSQTPDNSRMWTPLVHVSGRSKEPYQRTVFESPTTRHNAAMPHTGPDAIQGLHDGVNDSANPFDSALRSSAESPPSYAARNHIADDGKTVVCNRTLTFDTFVDDAQLDEINPLAKVKRHHRTRFRSWMEARVGKLRLMRKSR